ncbi:T9SS type A sorting domain-containing protein [candidate division KSB1 bacterium]|nr:T9SS type A sorting domain-containing protein [candidate division KSB1 bacterium]
MKIYLPMQISILLVLSLPFSVDAQWCSNPAQNTAIVCTCGNQLLPKIEATSNGGCYIAWFDNRSGNYSVYLQRLNSKGKPQWQSDGLLISDYSQLGWVADYDMMVDDANNAVIVFSDIRNGGTSSLDVFAYKISPGGDFLWGCDGLNLSDFSLACSEPDPKIVQTSDGNFVVTWARIGSRHDIVLQKLSASGRKLWGNDGIVVSAEDSGNVGCPNIIATEDNHAIIVWKHSTGSFNNNATDIFTQKFGSSGEPVWNACAVPIHENGCIPGYFTPQICSDGKGGAFYAWYDFTSLSEANVWVQHVASGGTSQFPSNGIKSTTNLDVLHLNPSIAHLKQAEICCVFWIEKNINQTKFGIAGQAFSTAGSRLWTEEGNCFQQLNANEKYSLRSAPIQNSICLCYLERTQPGVYAAGVKAFRIASDGKIVCHPALISSSASGNKDDLQLMRNSADCMFFTWHDERNDQGDIFAQNMHPDGSLGNFEVSKASSVLKRTSMPVLTNNYPNPFNARTEIRFQLVESQRVQITIYNAAGQTIRKLMNAACKPGFHRIRWNGTDASGKFVGSGVYLCRLKMGDAVRTCKMSLLK